MRKKGLALLFFLTIMMGLANAQAQSVLRYSNTLETRLYYSSKSVEIKIDPDFRDNKASLKAFLKSIKEISNDPDQKLGAVKIVVGVSPERTAEMSLALTKYRVESLESWLRDELKDGEISFETTAIGIDWKGLTKLVEETDYMPYKYEVLNILKNTPEKMETERGRIVEVRRRELTTLGEGEAWSWMEDNLFDELRTCTISVIYYNIYRAPRARDIDVKGKRTGSVAKASFKTSPTKGNGPYLSLKTNLLYDIALVPNLGLELSLGRRWSVGVDAWCAHWTQAEKNYYWCISGGELKLRKYLGNRALRNPLTGHHLGLYGNASTYYFALGGDMSYLGDWVMSGGFEYGYSVPIGKSLNLDFSIGIGYMQTKYRTYERVDGVDVWKETIMNKWLGPTKAEISLVWLLGKSNKR